MTEPVQAVLSGWAEFSSVADYLKSFVFRGQSCAEWGLTSSLERALLRAMEFNVIYAPENNEHWLLHEFRRRARLYLKDLPEEDSNFEWLAIMQHHGCPTRLVDFSASVYVALYFALEGCVNDGAVWCINRLGLRDVALEKLRLYDPLETLKDRTNQRLIKYADRCIGEYRLKEGPRMVFPVEPVRLTERMNHQQGLFLFQTDARVSFLNCLLESMGFGTCDASNFKEIPITELRSDNWFTPHTKQPILVKLIIPRGLV